MKWSRNNKITVIWIILIISLLTVDIIVESRIDYIQESRIEEKLNHRTILRLSPGDYYFVLDTKETSVASTVSVTGYIQFYYQVLSPDNDLRPITIDVTIKSNDRIKIPFTIPENAVSSVVDISVEASVPITSYAVTKINLDKLEGLDQWRIYRTYLLIILGIISLYLLFVFLQYLSIKRGWNIPIITSLAETKPQQRYIPKSKFSNLTVTLDEGEIIVLASHSDFLKIKESILSKANSVLMKTISKKTRWTKVEVGTLILTTDRIIFNEETQSMNLPINEIKNIEVYQKKGMDPGILIEHLNSGGIMLFLVNDPWQWQDFVNDPTLMLPKTKTREDNKELCIACGDENTVTQEFCTNCGTNLWRPKNSYN